MGLGVSPRAERWAAAALIKEERTQPESPAR
jgi:hypothetical protein